MIDDAPAGRPLRIALMIESDGPGGAEIMLLNLADALRRRGHVVRPVGPAGGCGWLGAQLRARGLEPATFSLRWPVDPACLAGLVRLLRRERIDVVHSHEFSMAVYGGAAARIARVPHVITMHGGLYFARRWRRRAALRSAVRHSHSTVTVSSATRSALEEALGGPAPLVVIPNGIPLSAGSGGGVRREVGVAPGEPMILSIGNLYPVKGHRVLLEALADLRERRPELAWTTVLAGRGEEEAALRELAGARGIADRVRFLGFRDDVADLLDAADVFAFPSLSEGLPLALLEAMAAGRPIVASQVGGIPEAARPGQEALLVPPADTAALTSALDRLLTDPHLRGRLAGAARERMRTSFSLDGMTRAYERLYRSAVSRGGTDAPPGREPKDRGPPSGSPAPDRGRARRRLVHHLIAPAAVGGAESVIRALARAQRASGHEVAVTAVLSEGAADPPFLTALEEADVRLFRVVLPARAYLRERTEVGRLCRELGPQILHTHGYRPDVVDAGAARGLGIPTVATVHGFTGGGVKNRVYEWLQRRALRQFDAVVAVSTPLADELRGSGVAAERLSVVPNAWTAEAEPLDQAAARRALDVPADTFHVGWVGRVSHEKGPDVVLSALEHLPDLPLTLSMVGDGPCAPALRERTRPDPRVRWHGVLPDVARLFPAFDAFVLSSRTEGTPMVLLEAMAAGVPIIATRVGGVPDMLSADEALLVPSGDTTGLAAAIRLLCRDPRLAAERGRAGRARLEADFATPRWLERYDAVYDGALRAARDASGRP